MHPIVLFAASLGAAYLAGRLARREPFALADLAIGLVGGLAGMSVTQFLGAAEPGLALLIACGLPIGLGSLRRHAVAL
jgi:hypothetical protein